MPAGGCEVCISMEAVNDGFWKDDLDTLQDFLANMKSGQIRVYFRASDVHFTASV